MLAYDAIANVSAWTLGRTERRWPRSLCVIGFVGCAVPAANLPWESIAIGAGVLVVGLVVRAVRARD